MPLKLFSAVFLAIAVMLLCHGQGYADEVDFAAEIRMLKARLSEVNALKARVAELENQVVEQKRNMIEQKGTVEQVRRSLIQPMPGEELIKYEPGEGIELPYGFKIQADATFIVQGTPNANNAGDGESSRCDASWSSDIFIEKAFDDWGLALMHLEPGQGSTVESELSLYSNVNRDSNDTEANIPITEVWYEHYLFNKQVAVTAGKLDPANYLDQNEYAFDETTQFLGRIFRNSPVIEWPDDNTLGGVLALAPEFMPYVAVNAAYYNADNSYEEIFNKPFISTEISFMSAKAFGYDENMWAGNYRFYWWYNGLDHAKLVDQGESPADDSKLTNTGFGVSFDQMITDICGIFGRAGWQRPDVDIVNANPNVAPVEGMWSCGLQLNGKLWHREDDVLAAAVGQLFPSKHYKDAGNGGAAEGHLEVYYRAQITKNIAISPDFQWIWNPRGISESHQGDNNTIFVYGLRCQVNF